MWCPSRSFNDIFPSSSAKNTTYNWSLGPEKTRETVKIFCRRNTHINFETHFHKIYKKITGRVNLLRHIRFSTETIRAKRIYQSIIMSIFTYCGYISLGWSESRKRMIHSIKKGSLEIISRNTVRRTAIFDFLITYNFFAKESVLFCIWLSPKNGTVCFPFRNYFNDFTIML